MILGLIKSAGGHSLFFFHGPFRFYILDNFFYIRSGNLYLIIDPLTFTL